MATVSVDAAFVLDAVTYLISAAMLSLTPSRATAREEDSAGFGEDLKAGFTYLAGARVPLAIVLGAFLTVLTINITIPAEVFLAKGDLRGWQRRLRAARRPLWRRHGAWLSLDGRTRRPGRTAALLLRRGLRVGTGAGWSGSLTRLRLRAGRADGSRVANGTENVTTDTILQKGCPMPSWGVFSVRFLGFSVGEAFAYGLGGAIVDASGARFTYLLAGAASAGLVILIFLAIASDS